MKRKGTEGNAPKPKYLNVQKEYYELKKNQHWSFNKTDYLTLLLKGNRTGSEGHIHIFSSNICKLHIHNQKSKLVLPIIVQTR